MKDDNVTIMISKETKKRFDTARTTEKGRVTSDSYLAYLLSKEEKKGDRKK